MLGLSSSAKLTCTLTTTVLLMLTVLRSVVSSNDPYTFSYAIYTNGSCDEHSLNSGIALNKTFVEEHLSEKTIVCTFDESSEQTNCYCYDTCTPKHTQKLCEQVVSLAHQTTTEELLPEMERIAAQEEEAQREAQQQRGNAKSNALLFVAIALVVIFVVFAVISLVCACGWRRAYLRAKANDERLKKLRSVEAVLSAPSSSGDTGNETTMDNLTSGIYQLTETEANQNTQADEGTQLLSDVTTRDIKTDKTANTGTAKTRTRRSRKSTKPKERTEKTEKTETDMDAERVHVRRKATAQTDVFA